MLPSFIGLIPGLGAGIAQWMAYAHAVQSSRNGSNFGRGDVRGVIGPGAANNSGIGGGLIPTIAFGVPGSVSMAILLGAFLVQGLVPGPSMLTEHLELTFSFVWILVVSNVITVLISFLFLNQLVKITYIRGGLLISGIVLLVLLSGYVNSNSMLDMLITLLFGFMGLLMMYIDWPRPPLILGLVLGELVEKNLFISYTRYGLDFFARPVVIVILFISSAVIFLPMIRSKVLKRIDTRGADIATEED